MTKGSNVMGNVRLPWGDRVRAGSGRAEVKANRSLTVAPFAPLGPEGPCKWTEGVSSEKGAGIQEWHGDMGRREPWDTEDWTGSLQ